MLNVNAHEGTSCEHDGVNNAMIQFSKTTWTYKDHFFEVEKQLLLNLGLRGSSHWMSTSINTNFTKEIENNAHKHRQNVYKDFFWVISYNSHGDEKSHESKLYNISDFVDVLNIFLKGLRWQRVLIGVSHP